MRTLGALSVRVGLDALRANPLRTILSTLGVIMGVGSMVAVLVQSGGGAAQRDTGAAPRGVRVAAATSSCRRRSSSTSCSWAPSPGSRSSSAGSGS